MPKTRYNPAYAGTTGARTPCIALMTIQPRVCGDYKEREETKGIMVDTTPRMRGLPWVQRRGGVLYRYNPAYAGTTHPSCEARHHSSIQPRVCGDYARRRGWTGQTSDTTPRMRGLPPLLEQVGGVLRYNPAYAGTTNQWQRACDCTPIQPRVCGDYYATYLLVFPLFDTTPRMRGLLIIEYRHPTTCRYNPAYAGTTDFQVSRQPDLQIQPRVCGDYIPAI